MCLSRHSPIRALLPLLVVETGFINARAERMDTAAALDKYSRRTQAMLSTRKP
jgi:hypothetical protein